MTIESLAELLKEMVNKNLLIYGVLSSPSRNHRGNSLKVIVRPIMIKQKIMYQISDHDREQVKHRNVSEETLVYVICESLQQQFKQALFHTQEADYHILISNKQKMTILRKAPSKVKKETPLHNRKKHYILEEGTRIPFLVELGVMTAEGKVIAKMSDKFRQINRFVEMIADVVPYLERGKTIQIVDFGCGKAYLTFALYHYLHHVAGYTIEVVGLDLKREVIAKCQALAHTLGYHSLRFEVGDINDHCPAKPVDMVVSLHACDTATDAALEKAVRWNAAVILAVPCCQHELYSQVKNEGLALLLQHGILKERFAALATDAARAQLLTIAGYHTQILEFIDMEHTPKNLLIRAVRQKDKNDSPKALNEYIEFKNMLQITPSLEKRILHLIP